MLASTLVFTLYKRKQIIGYMLENMPDVGLLIIDGIRDLMYDITLWTGEPDRKVTTPDAYKAIPEIRALLDKEDYRGSRPCPTKGSRTLQRKLSAAGPTFHHLFCRTG